jgi:hypothetical protein
MGVCGSVVGRGTVPQARRSQVRVLKRGPPPPPNLPNPSSCTMALWSTQPLTEISTSNLPGVKGSQRGRPTISPASVSRLSEKCGSLDLSQPYGPSQPVAGIALLILTIYVAVLC